MSSCAKVLQGLATAVNLLCDVSMLGESVEAFTRTRDRGDDTMLETATVVNSLALVGFSIAEIAGIMSGTKSESLQTLKSIELVPRLVNFPLQLLFQGKQLDIQTDEDFLAPRNIIRLIEKGFVAPLVDITRTAAAEAAYYEQHFFDMTPEQLKEAKRPIYEREVVGDDVYWKIVGYKPVDLEECRKNLADYRIQFEAATIVRVAAQDRVLEIVVCDLGLPTIQRLAAFFGRFAPIAGGPGGGPGGGAGGPGGYGGGGYWGGAGGLGRYGDEGDEDGPGGPGGPGRPADHPVEQGALHTAERELDINLLSYPNIPTPLHGDHVFQQYICPITHQPIRDPVRDPTNGMTLYERSAIVNWLQHNPVSPLTRRPLRTEDLQDAPTVRNQINSRLQEYQDALRRFLEEHASAPATH